MVGKKYVTIKVFLSLLEVAKECLTAKNRMSGLET
jgi:hypothetical protein